MPPATFALDASHMQPFAASAVHGIPAVHVAKRKATAADTLPPICVGAVLASLVMYPVDVVRAICMSHPGTGPSVALRGFLEIHGAIGFVRQGLGTEILRASMARAIKFFLQPVVHQSLYCKPESQGTPVSKGLAGTIGAIPEVIAISPLENMKLAAQLDDKRKFAGSVDIAKHILRTRGISGMFVGYVGLQLRTCLWTFGFFSTLDWYKSQSQAFISHTLARDVIAGFGAGASGTLLNCWTDVSRSVVQRKALADTFDARIPRPSALEPLNPAPFFRTAALIFQERGMTGLYSGVGPKMIHLGGSGALLAVVMPRFKSMWFDAINVQT